MKGPTELELSRRLEEIRAELGGLPLLASNRRRRLSLNAELGRIEGELRRQVRRRELDDRLDVIRRRLEAPGPRAHPAESAPLLREREALLREKSELAGKEEGEGP